jgi:hypothetical protein
MDAQLRAPPPSAGRPSFLAQLEGTQSLSRRFDFS